MCIILTCQYLNYTFLFFSYLFSFLWPLDYSVLAENPLTSISSAQLNMLKLQSAKLIMNLSSTFRVHHRMKIKGGRERTLNHRWCVALSNCFLRTNFSLFLAYLMPYKLSYIAFLERGSILHFIVGLISGHHTFRNLLHREK